MKNRILLLMFISMAARTGFAAEVIAENEIIREDYYLEGPLKEQVISLAGQKDAFLIRRYFSSGELMKEINLIKNKPEGAARLYHRNGALKAEANYKDGLWDGESKVYDENGRLISEGVFSRGDGIEREYDQEGRLKAESPYRHGRLDGVRKEFYENGVLRFEDIFEKGRRISRKKYERNGGLEFHEIYRLNPAKRIFVYLWENLNADVAHEVYKSYYADGSLKKESAYLIGTLDGITRVYRRNGMIKYEDTYRKGKKARRKKYSSEGRLESSEERKGRGGMIRQMIAEMKRKGIIKGESQTAPKASFIPLIDINK